MSGYKWRSSYRGRVSADIAGPELERVKAEHGALTAELVVDEARSEDAPLHPVFEWRDEVAAEQHRMQQAYRLIRALVVVDEVKHTERPAYVLVTSEETRTRTTYEDAAVVVADVDLFADAIGRLEGEVRAARRSVQDLERLASSSGVEPERMARIALAVRAIEAANAAVAALH